MATKCSDWRNTVEKVYKKETPPGTHSNRSGGPFLERPSNKRPRKAVYDYNYKINISFVGGHSEVTLFKGRLGRCSVAVNYGAVSADEFNNITSHSQ